MRLWIWGFVLLPALHASACGGSEEKNDIALSTAGANGAFGPEGSAGQGGQRALGNNAAAGTTSTGIGGGSANPAGYLHTDGARIVDKTGQTVILRSVNWYGMETDPLAPGGLNIRSLRDYLTQIKSLGFTTLRIPYTNKILDPQATTSGIDFGKNPELQGLSPLQLLDKLIEEAGALGLWVILDRHRPTPVGQTALWFTGDVPESKWIDDWKTLALRYKDKPQREAPTVIGVDLHNEPHGAATWGDGSSNDWRAAAIRAGNTILAVHPDLLVIVEGIGGNASEPGWDGGNLRGARAHPVTLSSPGHVVYSPHDYPETVYKQAWFSASDYPNNLPAAWREVWGYLVEENLAPVWVGEFGTRLETERDRQWLTGLVTYLQKQKVSFAYWCWNPNSDGTGGLLGGAHNDSSDWLNVAQGKLDVLAPLLKP